MNKTYPNNNFTNDIEKNDYISKIINNFNSDNIEYEGSISILGEIVIWN